MRITVAVAALALSIVSLSATAQVPTTTNRAPTNIPAQELGPALRALARDRNFQIVFATKDVSSLRTHGTVGELTADEALTQILSGTGLTYHRLDDKTISILPANAKTAPQARTEPNSPEVAGADDAKEGKKDTSNSFRLAQEVQGASAEPSAVGKENSESASQTKPAQFEEIVVEPPRERRRLVGVSQAAIGISRCCCC
ncbi:MAG: STN domain-containing protein [Rudaea sp.]|uniref:STN domain-containing protein n=1 Tax=Rudaea sp. TaxID=2136325 RepID=UPI0039E2A8EF